MWWRWGLLVLVLVLVVLLLNRKESTFSDVGDDFICSIPTNQIGNCLRSLVSMKILADVNNIKLKIDDSQVHSGKEQKVLRTLFKDYEFIDSSKDTVKVVDEKEIADFYEGYGTNGNPLIEGTFKDNLDKNFGCRHIYSIKPYDITDEEYIKRKIQVYKSLHWPTQNFKFPENLENVIGFHVRLGDNLSDTSKLHKNTTREEFYKKIDETPKPIFICSDNQDVIRTLKDKYPDTITADKVDDPELQAIYEMMCLSKTKHIIGSYASTFSYESAFFKGTDLEVFENGSWKVYKISQYT
jgi:hypothetical protein